MRTNHRSFGYPLVLAIGLASAGCSGAADDLPREAVWGKVTVDGAPLAKGAIRFQTSTPGAPNVMEVGGLIQDGEFQIARSQGPVPGTYRVTITEDAASPLAPGEAPGPRPKVKASRISGAGNGLSAEVKKGQSDPIEFALRSDVRPASDDGFASRNTGRAGKLGNVQRHAR
jgi:hypothetical protein